MNDQKLFNRVVKHLLTQNSRSAIDFRSRYHHPDGRKSAVGFLIKPDYYEAYFESYHSQYPDVLDAVAKSVGGSVNHVLLGRLEEIHDHYPDHRWYLHFADIAKDYQLKKKVIKKTIRERDGL